MRNSLIIVGTGGHGKVVADIAVRVGYKKISFLDDAVTGSRMGFPVVGKGCDIEDLKSENTDFILAIGNNSIRERFAQKYNVNWATLVHPSAQIGMDVTIGEGTVVMAGAVINPCTVLGAHCIINTGAVVEHDNIIEDYVHISPNAALGGTVRVGMKTHIGIGAAVKNNINICDNCVIGAGGVVVKDITESGTYIGVPVKRNILHNE